MSTATESSSNDSALASATAREPNHRLPLLVLAAAVLLVYMSASGRFFAADQLIYLAQLNGSRSLTDGLALYDYSLSRTYWRGDDLLFRPALFVLLAVQNTLFHHDFTAWNIATYCIHVLVVWTLYFLLWTIQPSSLALLLALWFAVSRGGSDLVMWNHLGGYLFGFFFILVALKAAWTIAQGQVRGYREHAICFGALFIGALFYEIAIPLAVLLAAWLGLLGRRTRSRAASLAAVACLAAVGIWLALYIVHCVRVPQLLWVDRGGINVNPIKLIVTCANAGISLLADHLVPWTFFDRFDHGDRPVREFLAWPYGIPRYLQAAGVIAVVIVLLYRGIDRELLKRRLPFIGVLLLTLAAYLFLIAFGRTAQSATIGYYAYFVGLIAVIVLYSLIDVQRLSRRNVVVAGVFIGAAALLHAVLVYNVGRRFSEASRGADTYFGRVDAIIAQYAAAEPDFTFSVDYGDPQLDFQQNLVIGYPAAREGVLTLNLSELLNIQYYDPQNPKYRLFLQPDGTWAAIPRGSPATAPAKSSAGQ